MWRLIDFLIHLSNKQEQWMTPSEKIILLDLAKELPSSFLHNNSAKKRDGKISFFSDFTKKNLVAKPAKNPFLSGLLGKIGNLHNDRSKAVVACYRSIQAIIDRADLDFVLPNISDHSVIQLLDGLSKKKEVKEVACNVNLIIFFI